VSSLLELACGWESVDDPNGGSETGTETTMRGEVGSSDGRGVSIGPRDDTGGGDRGTGGDISMEMGVVILAVSVRGSV
jgi:hypothetical protein